MTSPRVSASAASTRRPVSARSRARAPPTRSWSGPYTTWLNRCSGCAKRGVVGADAQVAHDREVEAAAERGAVHRGDGRQREGQHGAVPPVARRPEPRRRGSASANSSRSKPALNVSPAPVTTTTRTAVSAAELVERVAHLVAQRDRERVALLGSGEGEHRDAVGVRPVGPPRAAIGRAFASGRRRGRRRTTARSAIRRRYCMRSRGRLNATAPTSRPSRPTAATNRRSSREPSTISMRSSPRTRPTTWIFTSYWSDQTNGTGSNGGASPLASSSRRATNAPCSAAFVQCSRRIDSPSKSGFGQRATSPGGDDAGRGEARRVAHHPVLEGEPGPLEPVGGGAHTDPDDDDVGRDDGAVAEHDPFDPVVAFEAGDAHAEAQVDAVVAVQLRRARRRASGRGPGPSARAAPRGRSRRAPGRGTWRRPRRR